MLAVTEATATMRPMIAKTPTSYTPNARTMIIEFTIPATRETIVAPRVAVVPTAILSAFTLG